MQERTVRDGISFLISLGERAIQPKLNEGLHGMNMLVNDLPIFGADETHGRALRVGNRLIAHSASSGWRPLHAAILEEGPLNIREAAVAHPSIIYHLSRPTTVTRRIEGTRREKTFVVPRRLCVTPGGISAQWEHKGNPEILQIYLRRSIYENAVAEICNVEPSKAPLLPRFAVLDPLLEQLAIAIATALRDGTAEDGLYIGTLAQMMAVHLARQHTHHSRKAAHSDSMTVTDSRIRRVLEFVEENLEGDLSLENMANEMGVSAVYFPHVFKSAVGQSPHRYVLGRRIQRAQHLLRNSDLPITEIALSSGFSSHSHLSTCFVRVVRVSPSTYRRDRR